MNTTKFAAIESRACCGSRTHVQQSPAHLASYAGDYWSFSVFLGAHSGRDTADGFSNRRLQAAAGLTSGPVIPDLLWCRFSNASAHVAAVNLLDRALATTGGYPRKTGKDRGSCRATWFRAARGNYLSPAPPVRRGATTRSTRRLPHREQVSRPAHSGTGRPPPCRSACPPGDIDTVGANPCTRRAAAGAPARYRRASPAAILRSPCIALPIRPLGAIFSACRTSSDRPSSTPAAACR